MNPPSLRSGADDQAEASSALKPLKKTGFQHRIITASLWLCTNRFFTCVSLKYKQINK